MTCKADTLKALEVFPNGLTVAELQQLLGRTGGDITKAVSTLKHEQVRINAKVEFNPFTNRRTVRYTLIKDVA